MNLISMTDAGKIAGVSRQAISKMKKLGTYDFYKGSKVDISSEHWKAYLNERGLKSEKKAVTTPAKKKVVKNVPRGTSKKVSKKKSGKETTRQKHALTGGQDPSTMIATTPSQLKALTDIQEKNINMRVRLDELIEVDMFVSILEIVMKDIKNFVTLGRKVSNLICQKLDAVGMEKQVEAIINPEVEAIIKMTKKNMIKNIDIKSYK